MQDLHTSNRAVRASHRSQEEENNGDPQELARSLAIVSDFVVVA